MLNKVMLLGRLGADPDLKYLPNGTEIATLRLATSRRWKDKNTGERKEDTEWHRVVLFGSLGKIAADYLKKGSQCYVEGRIRTQKWQDQSGQDRYTTEIIGEELKLLDSKSSNAPSAAINDQPPASAPDQSGGYDYDDDIPFASLNGWIKNHLV